jgi:hypothetical protein
MNAIHAGSEKPTSFKKGLIFEMLFGGGSLNTHKQHQYDFLSVSLNEYRAICKEKKRKYEVKLGMYKELYNSLEEEYISELLFPNFINFCGFIFKRNKNNIIKKSGGPIKECLEITQRLINLANQIIENNNFHVESEIALLENMLGYEFDYVAYLFPRFYVENDESLYTLELQMQIDFILALIKEYTTYLFRNLKRDLRFRYRSIIHFLFKNMDDTSDECNNLHESLKHRLLPIFNYSYNGKQRNNFTIEKYWKGRIACYVK